MRRFRLLTWNSFQSSLKLKFANGASEAKRARSASETARTVRDIGPKRRAIEV
jgi:hypothetical protein